MTVVSTDRRWRVTISATIEGVSDDPRFPSLFEEALARVPAAQDVESRIRLAGFDVSAILLVRAPDGPSADRTGMEILRGAIDAATRRMTGTGPAHRTLQVRREPDDTSDT